MLGLSIASERPLTSPHRLRALFPLNDTMSSLIERKREEIAAILEGRSSRLLLILGPCSIHSEEGALLYGEKLARLQEELSPTFLFVMRCYFEKSRSRLGWKGMFTDPHLDDSGNVEEGVIRSRRILWEMAKMGVATATELIDPLSFLYYGDLLSWGCVGARTTTSQLHRQIASALPFPVGFKNPLDGCLELAISAIEVATHSHTFPFFDGDGGLKVVKSMGNAFAHLVLRGGRGTPNFDRPSILTATMLMRARGIHSRVIVDCSHDNSGKEIERQKEAFFHVLETIHQEPGLVRGVMLESYLKEGAQKHSSKPDHALSLTDPCLSWDETERLLFAAVRQLQR